MDQKPVNPLVKHFRQPSIYLRLPSRGEYWPESSLTLPVNGEIAVYPMTTKDEILLRTPDALINGSGVVNVIQSCCPDIKNAWDMPSIDLDAVIIAIRIASFGHHMTFASKCPKCEELHDYEIDLRNVLENIRMPNYKDPLETNQLKIKLYPQPYSSFNQTSQIEFEEQKLLQAIQNSGMSEEQRSIQINQQTKKIIDLSYQTLAFSTEYIELPDGTRVTEKEFLKEFYENSGADIIRTVQEKLLEFNKQGAVKPMKVNCTDCSNEFEIQFNFDYSSFFDKGF